MNNLLQIHQTIAVCPVFAPSELSKPNAAVTVTVTVTVTPP